MIKGGTIDFDNGADMNNDSDCIGTERTVCVMIRQTVIFFSF